MSKTKTSAMRPLLFFDIDATYLCFRSKESLLTARWYSSWILLSAYLPLILVYSVWIPLTYSGRWNSSNDEAIFGNLNAGRNYGTSNIFRKPDVNIDEFDSHLRDAERESFLDNMTSASI